MRLPRHVKHIVHPQNAQRTWCGADKEVFMFTGLDHVAGETLSEGDLLACSACMGEAVAVLDAGTAEDREPDKLPFVENHCRVLNKAQEFLSSINTDHPAYKNLLLMARNEHDGNEYIRAILWLLERGEVDDPIPFWHLFVLLGEVTGADPVPSHHAGVWGQVRNAWVEWGRNAWDD